MRVSEKERLNTLRTKKATGTELSEKELARLESLEEIERKEIDTNARGNSINPGGNDSTNGSDGSRNGESAEQGKRDQPIINAPGSSGTNGKSDKLTRKPDRTTIGAIGNDGSLDGSNGSDRGSLDCEEYGGNRGDQDGEPGEGDGGNSESQEIPSTKVVNGLTPDVTVKPRRKSPTKKTPVVNNPVVNGDLDFIGIILQSGFGMIASATNRQHWNISQEEATSVSQPLTKMFDALDKVQKKKLEKYINPVMLASAVAGIMIPRLMMEAQIQRGATNGKRAITTSNVGITENNDRRNEEPGKQIASSDILETNSPDVNSILAGFNK